MFRRAATTRSAVAWTFAAAALPLAGGSTPAPQTPPPSAAPYDAAWAVPVAGQGPVAVAAGARHVFLTDGDDRLVARALDDGREVWSAPLNRPAAVVAGDAHVFTLASGDLRALDADTGRVVWRAAVPAATAGPIWRAGWLLTLVDRRLTGLRAHDGSSVWQADLDAAPLGGPVIAGNHLFLALEDQRLAALDLLTGRVLWTTRLDTLPGPLLAAHGRVYFGGADGLLYAYRQDRGRLDWAYRARLTIVDRPAADGRHVYFAALDNTVRALHWERGNLEWSLPLTARPHHGPLVLEDHLIVPVTSGDLLACRAATGAFVGALAAPGGGAPRLLALAASADQAWLLRVTVAADTGRTLTAYRKPPPAAGAPAQVPGSTSWRY